MGVPCVNPLLCVLVDGREEQMMQEPDVNGDGWIEAMGCFQTDEKVLPLFSEPTCDVVPEAFDSCVVYAPVGGFSEASAFV